MHQVRRRVSPNDWAAQHVGHGTDSGFGQKAGEASGLWARAPLRKPPARRMSGRTEDADCRHAAWKAFRRGSNVCACGDAPASAATECGYLMTVVSVTSTHMPCCRHGIIKFGYSTT